ADRAWSVDRARVRRRNSPRRSRCREQHGRRDHPSPEECAVITPSAGVRVLVASKPVDFRKGADGLAAVVKDEMGADPFSGVIYVFRAKRADRVKLLFWDGSGV